MFVPPLSLQDFARAAVLRSNPYWPFSWVNRAPYHLAVRLLARVCARSPEIAAVYLRNSMADGTWTPGASDIDFAVILRAGLPPEREFACLDSFWSGFRRLKRWFPMLGEADIFDESQAGLWLYWGAQSPAPPVWKLVHGTGGQAAPRIAPSPRWRVFALKTALWFYLEKLLPELERAESFPAMLGLARLGRKIQRLAALVSGSGPSGVPLDGRDRGALLAPVLGDLERAAIALGEPAGLDLVEAPPGPRLPVRGAVASVLYDWTGRAYVLFDDGLDAARVAGAYAGNRGLWSPEKPPVYLGPAVFSFLLHHYWPRQYRDFSHSRAIAFGGDPLPGCRPPGFGECRDALLDQIPNAFLFPRSEIFFRGGQAPPVAELESGLRQVLPVLLAQSGDLTHEQALDPMPTCHVRFAPEFAGLESLSRQDAFLRFHRLSRQVQASASRSG